MGDEMSGGGEIPPAAPDWVRIRSDYEAGVRPVADLAKEAGLGSWQELSQRARRESWKRRYPALPKAKATRDTLGRLKHMLNERIADLGEQIGHIGERATATENERDIRSMNTLVRTLEKVLELERKERTARAKRRKQRRDVDDASRLALAERIAGLRRQHSAAPDQ